MQRDSDPLRQRICVFMPTWRCKAWLAKAIDSVLAQTHPAVDLYVADDAGGDVDEEILKRYPQVTFLRMNGSGGPYRIDNLLLRITSSEYVAFHDADDWSYPHRFEAQINFLTNHALDGCGSWCLHVDLNGDPVGFDTAPGLSDLPCRDARNRLLFHPTTMYKRSVFDTLRGFDTSTRFSADTEFIWRASLSFSLANVPRFLYVRTLRPASLTQHPDTGIRTPARAAYGESIRRHALAIFEGTAPPPAPGMLTTGRPVVFPSLDCVEWIRPGRGNTTLSSVDGLRVVP